MRPNSALGVAVGGARSMSDTLSKYHRLTSARRIERSSRVFGSARKQGPPLSGDFQRGKKQAIAVHDSKGMVSILVTMVIMVVISLIVIGFARIVQREQRQVLDRQLSTQAFYAAESGINDAANAIKNGYTANKTSCGTDATFTDNTLDTDVAYSCLLIDQSPTSLEYGSIETDKSTIIPIKAESGNMHELILTWQDKSGDTGVNCTYALGSFPPASSWPSDCNAGVLRIDLTPVGDSDELDRTSLLENTLTAFLQPVQGGGGELTYNLPANKGGIVGAVCNSSATPKICSVTIKTLGPLSPNSYMRVRSIYKSNSLNIVAKDASGNLLELVGGQAIIDSTGKASDVLRRIVTRVPVSNIKDTPDFAIQSSDTICKRFSAGPGFAITDSTPGCELN